MLKILAKYEFRIDSMKCKDYYGLWFVYIQKMPQKCLPIIEKKALRLKTWKEQRIKNPLVPNDHARLEENVAFLAAIWFYWLVKGHSSYHMEVGKARESWRTAKSYLLHLSSYNRIPICALNRWRSIAVISVLKRKTTIIKSINATS